MGRTLAYELVHRSAQPEPLWSIGNYNISGKFKRGASFLRRRLRRVYSPLCFYDTGGTGQITREQRPSFRILNFHSARLRADGTAPSPSASSKVNLATAPSSP